MPYRLLKYAWQEPSSLPRFLPAPAAVRKHYDVIIIGGGGHGLATAYYLARNHGITNVAVLERNYMGSGGTGRNTAITRANYLTPEGIRFYAASLGLFEGLSQELDINLLYAKRGHFTLAHTEAGLRTARWRAEVNKHLGVDSEVVGPEFIKQRVPEMDLTCGHNMPVVGALYHPPGAISRHDGVAWGYARGAAQRGVHVHQGTEVTGLRVASGRVTGVETNHGVIEGAAVLSATAGFTPRILQMAGIRSPITVHPLQACVTEPMKPWLNAIIVSSTLHIYVSQSSRGELVMGAAVDPYELHNTRTSLGFMEGLAGHICELFPFLAGIKIMRQWAGICDMTPDFSPIMGKTPIDGFFIDAGWGTWGYKATPICGVTMAHTLANNDPHELIRPFRLSRFAAFDLVGEKGAAAVGH